MLQAVRAYSLGKFPILWRRVAITMAHKQTACVRVYHSANTIQEYGFRLIGAAPIPLCKWVNRAVVTTGELIYRSGTTRGGATDMACGGPVWNGKGVRG